MDRNLSDGEKRKRKARQFAKVGIVLIMAGGAIFGMSQFMRSSVKLENLIVGEISRGTIETTISANGTVIPEFEEAIITPISAKILKVYAQSGEMVDEGAPLLQLDLQAAQTNHAKMLDEYRMKQLQTEQLRANKEVQLSDREMQIKVSQMQLGRLEVELRNERYLDSLGSGTMDRVRQAELAVNTARLELEQMRQRYENERKASEADMQLKQLENSIFAKALEESRRTLENAEIRSPRRATLTYICDEEIGTLVSAGTKVAIVSDLTQFKLQCSIADAYSDRVRTGGKVVVKIGATGLSGVISSVAPMTQNGLVSFNVTLEEPAHSRLRSGLRVDVHVLTSIKENVLRIKNSSFYRGADTYQMFVLTDKGLAEKRSVQLGDCNFDFIEVLGGLREGERVILSDMSRYASVAEIKVK